MNVLIADDELQARQLLTRLLAGLPHVTMVVECRSGDEVLERLNHADDDDPLAYSRNRQGRREARSRPPVPGF